MNRYVITPLDLQAADIHAAAPLLEAALRAVKPEIIMVRLIEFTPPIEPWMRFSFDIRVWIGGAILHAHVTNGGFWGRWYMRTPPWLKEAVQAWYKQVQTLKAMSVAKERMAAIKEDLMAAAWHPDRVAKLVEAGAWDALD
jgi:hypothetical protein